MDRVKGLASRMQVPAKGNEKNLSDGALTKAATEHSFSSGSKFIPKKSDANDRT